MEFKKHFVAGSVDAKAPVVSHLRVRRITKRWFLTPDRLEDGAQEGYFSVKDGQLSIKTAEGEPDVVYKIVRGPGWYCCHCAKKLSDSVEGAAHVKAEHAGVTSPDDNNPSGWSRDNHYTLEWVSGGDPKPEVGAGGRLRYAAQQNARREAARQKIEANAAKAKVTPIAS